MPDCSRPRGWTGHSGNPEMRLKPKERGGLRTLRPSGPGGVHRARPDLRPERARPTSATLTSRSSRWSIPSEERRAQRQADWPEAATFASAAELAASGIEVDAVEALLPIPLHADGVIELLG